MKKQIFHIIMTLFLMVSTLGFTITKHYCGGELIDLSITGDVKSCCDMQGGDCCHDESQTYQMNEIYTSPVVFDHVDYFTFVACVIPVLLVEQQEQTSFVSSLKIGESPPPRDVLHFLSDIQVYRL